GRVEHGGTRAGVGDASAGFEIAGRGGGEPRLDDVDVEPLELAGNGNLLFDVHGASRRLLAIAQGGVEDPHVIGSGGFNIEVGHRSSPRLPLDSSEKAASSKKGNAPGGFFGPPPGALVSVLRGRSDPFRDAPGVGPRKGQAKKQSG